VYQTLQDESLAARTATGSPDQYVVNKLRLGEVHRVATGSDVLVAVIDSKIDSTHPDLAGAIVEHYDAVGRKEAPHSHGTGMAGAIAATTGKGVDENKPWFIGDQPKSKKEALPSFQWNESEGELKKTALNQTHRDLGGRMVPFAGWEMPVQYTGIFEEHLATRNAAGLFDVSHMGVYDVRGADAASFLDTVCGNDCGGLLPGESLYSHFLTPDADVIDDTLIYRRGWDNYLVVVNASNDDKDRTWLER